MSLPNSAIKKPANDLTSFDVSKHSPEQIAQLFARWKEQRRRLEHAPEPAPVRARNLRVMPRPKPSSTKTEAPASGRVEHPDSRSRSPHYSADFAAVLGAGGDRSAAQQIKNLKLRPATRASRAGNIVRSRLAWTLAGAASVIAMTAVAGAVLWPDGSNVNRRLAASSAEPYVAPVIEPAPEVQTALPLLPAVTRRTVAEPSLRSRLADLARWPSTVETTKAALLPILKPDSPAILTASDGMDSAELATGIVSALGPVRIAADRSEGFATAASGAMRDAEAAAAPAHATPRPAAPDDGGRDKLGLSGRSGAFVAGLQGDRSPPDRPGGSADTSDPGGPVGGGPDHGTGAGGSGGPDGSGAGGDVSGGGSVSSGSNGPSGSAGGGTSDAGDTAGRDTSGGGDAEGGESSEGDAGGDPTDGHAGEGGPGGSKSGGGDVHGGKAGGGGDADSGESGDSEGGDAGEGESGEGESGGGESGDGDSGDGDSESGESDGESGESSSRGGLRGAVGGLLGGARDVIGGVGKAKGKGADGGKDKGGKDKGGKGNGGGKD